MTKSTRYDQAFWQSHHEQWIKSGQTQVDYCAGAGINIKTFQNWKYRNATSKVRKASLATEPDNEISLIPLRLASSNSGGASFEGGRDIQIRFIDGVWVVDVTTSVDYVHILNVLKAVAGVSK